MEAIIGCAGALIFSGALKILCEAEQDDIIERVATGSASTEDLILYEDALRGNTVFAQRASDTLDRYRRLKDSDVLSTEENVEFQRRARRLKAANDMILVEHLMLSRRSRPLIREDTPQRRMGRPWPGRAEDARFRDSKAAEKVLGQSLDRQHSPSRRPPGFEERPTSQKKAKVDGAPRQSGTTVQHRPDLFAGRMSSPTLNRRSNAKQVGTNS